MLGRVAKGGLPGDVVVQLADGGEDEAEERGRGAEGTGGVLGVELRGHKVRVVLALELEDLHALGLVVVADKDQALGLEVFEVGRVDLVAMSVALGDLVLAVQFLCKKSGKF